MMPFSGRLLKVNGYTLPGVKEYKLTYAKLWKDAERNMNGDVSATLIGVFPKIAVTFRDALTENEISEIASRINAAYFTLEYFNPRTKGLVRAEYYAGDYDVEMLDKQRGLYKEFTVSFVPVTKFKPEQIVDGDYRNADDVRW